MWIFTRYGFFSVVCARQGEGQPGQPVDPDRVMIRARSKDDYDNFKAEVDKRQHEAREGYAHALHEVWGVMHKVQQRHTK
jgi:hypothetical protein